VLRGPTAPLTCLTVLLQNSSQRQGRVQTQNILFAGCWDKAIYSTPCHTPAATEVLPGGAADEAFAKGGPGIVFRGGHSDFVKCVLAQWLSPFPQATDKEPAKASPRVRSPFSPALLLSGSADSNIVAWNALTGAKLATIRGHKTSVLAFEFDPCNRGNPYSHGDRENAGDEESDRICDFLILYSASSSGEIRQWDIRVDGRGLLPGASAEAQTSAVHAVTTCIYSAVHPTSVYGLAFADLALPEHPRLFTASADGTAALVRTATNGWRQAQVDGNAPCAKRFTHGGHVRCLSSPDEELLVTGGRDEDVKVWDVETGELTVTLQGHFDEVTGVTVLARVVGRQLVDYRVVSVSLDGTVRLWVVKDEIAKAEAMADEEDEGTAEQVAEVEEDPVEKEGGASKKEIQLTAEEEAELAELMDDD